KHGTVDAESDVDQAAAAARIDGDRWGRGLGLDSLRRQERRRRRRGGGRARLVAGARRAPRRPGHRDISDADGDRSGERQRAARRGQRTGVERLRRQDASDDDRVRRDGADREESRHDVLVTLDTVTREMVDGQWFGSEKVTVTVITIAAGTPLTSVGVNRHERTARSAARASVGGDRSTATATTRPSSPIVASRTTMPSMRATSAMRG